MTAMMPGKPLNICLFASVCLDEGMVQNAVKHTEHGFFPLNIIIRFPFCWGHLVKLNGHLAHSAKTGRNSHNSKVV